MYFLQGHNPGKELIGGILIKNNNCICGDPHEIGVLLRLLAAVCGCGNYEKALSSTTLSCYIFSMSECRKRKKFFFGDIF